MNGSCGGQVDQEEHEESDDDCVRMSDAWKKDILCQFSISYYIRLVQNEATKRRTRDSYFCCYDMMYRMSHLGTYVKDFKTGDIKYTDEMLPLLFGVQCLVTLDDEPFEAPVEHGLSQGTHGIGTLIFVTTLSHKLISDFDSRFAQILVEISGSSSQKGCDFLSLLCSIRLCLLLSGPLFELQFSEMHDGRYNFVDIQLLLLWKSEDIKGFLWIKIKYNIRLVFHYFIGVKQLISSTFHNPQRLVVVTPVIVFDQQIQLHVMQYSRLCL